MTMKCQPYREYLRKIIRLLSSLSQSDDGTDTSACEEPVKEYPEYCYKHTGIHRRYGDGTTACLECAEELVQLQKKEALQFWRRISQVLSPEDNKKLLSLAEADANQTGDGEEVSILRLLAICAVRYGCSIEDVCMRILIEYSIRLLTE